MFVVLRRYDALLHMSAFVVSDAGCHDDARLAQPRALFILGNITVCSIFSPKVFTNGQV